MTALRLSAIIGVVSCLLGFTVARCAAAGPATAPTLVIQTAFEPIAQLAPGKTTGMWRLDYHGRAEFSLAGHCTLLVTISERFHDDITALHLSDAKEFTVEADLQPGTYSVAVSAEKENADYWPSELQKIHIDKAGRLYQPHRGLPRPGVFVLERRINGVTPANLTVVDEKQPLLKWSAIPGATHYGGDFRGSAVFFAPIADPGNGIKKFDVNETQYLFGDGLIGGSLSAGKWIYWRLYALDANEKRLAYGEGTLFGHGTDEAVVARWRPKQAIRFDPLMDEASYLGMKLCSAQAPKDPRTPMKYTESGADAAQGDASGFIPGVEVTDVLSFSPAADADLHPEDVIIAVDGQPVVSENNMGVVSAFKILIRDMQPGRQITLTVRRFPHEMSLRATIGKYPGAGPTGGPATQPAPNVPTTAPK